VRSHAFFDRSFREGEGRGERGVCQGSAP
jgi:hypothetical protein